jgi:hypothetical protein
MDTNDVQVGFLQTRPKLDADGDQKWHVRYEAEDGSVLKKPVVEETMQAHGFRVMHVDMLGRIARRLTELGVDGHIPGIVGWLTEQPPEPALIAPMVAKLRDLEGKARDEAKAATSRADRQRWHKDAIYFEAAAFCWDAWLQYG